MPASDKYYRYNHSLKGLTRHARHRQTERYRLAQDRFYAEHGGIAAYSREHYHRVQDEVGRHSNIRDFYRGHCFLQALVNAEVVEV